MSITFDNSDKKQSPLGFEVHDEITVTRQVSGCSVFAYLTTCMSVVCFGAITLLERETL